MDEQSERSTGRMVDGWQILEELGTGGNATVWRARQGASGEVALKIIDTGTPSTERYQRFQREVEILERLRDRPGILPMLDYHFPDPPGRRKHPWLTMPIATRIDIHLGANPPLRDVVTAIAQVAATLADLASREGASHRDLKPDNLYWLEGSYVVGDFGLVKIPDRAALTRSEHPPGARHFIAPEMLQHPLSADWFPADVFSLAKTLWCLAAGDPMPPPWDIPAHNVQVRLSERVALAEAAPLDLLIERATHWDPTQRPSMAEFRDQLTAWSEPAHYTPSPLTLDDLFARLRVSNAAANTAALQRERWQALAVQALDRLHVALSGLLRHLKTSGASNVELRLVKGAWAYLEGGMSGGEGSVWGETAGSIFTAVTDERRFVRHNLLTGAGVTLFEDGQINIAVGHVVSASETREGVDLRGAHPAEVLWQGSRRIAVGSPMEQQAIVALMQMLEATYPEALLETLRRHESYPD
jgi:serine/threonine protein kinase